ncbi:MAG: DNA phosphorothioation-dependent restriction protein DptG [Lachnospiraceae bacterium]|nr:DNA phosphorothioation-dependent restriction protein DptG [Lachnospiraceae bacterium]
MEYIFDEEKFIESFNAKSSETKSADSMRLTHRADNKFKLFPYKASGKAQAPVVTDLEDVVSGFFKEALNKKTDPIDFEDLCSAILDEIEVDCEDLEYFKDMLQSIFFEGDNFVATNLGLYPYQIATNNKSADNLAHFLFSVFGVNKKDCDAIITAKNKYHFNVLEDMVIKTIETKKVSEAEKRQPYFSIKTDIQDRFRKDFYFMLESGMTSLEDISNLFAIYYFYYVSQICIILDHYCSGERDGEVNLYYALDWEKVSKNRMCCIEGWEKLQGSISHMFSHAITLEILNQTTETEMCDYISLGIMAEESQELDEKIAGEVAKAEVTYCSYVGDYKDFDKIAYQQGSTETEKAIRHLYRCVEAQFMNTERKRANQFYNEKFSDFCKSRWVKNRKKSGLVLNLTERDVIFLTKICLRDEEKIRLNELYKEYEYRGIYLDSTSKEYLQDFFTKLNLIDKKSDSGDAQYVKRIL